MAKRKPKPAVRGKCTIIVGEISINGRQFSGVSFSRTEYDDGRVVERGRPKGLRPGANIGEIFKAAFEQQEQDQTNG